MAGLRRRDFGHPSSSGDDGVPDADGTPRSSQRFDIPIRAADDSAALFYLQPRPYFVYHRESAPAPLPFSAGPGETMHAALGPP